MLYRASNVFKRIRWPMRGSGITLRLRVETAKALLHGSAGGTGDASIEVNVYIINIDLSRLRCAIKPGPGAAAAGPTRTSVRNHTNRLVAPQLAGASEFYAAWWGRLWV